MFGIRRIFDDSNPADQMAFAEAQALIRKQFPGLNEQEAAELPEILKNPLKFRFRSILFLAEDSKGGVRGLAVLRHAPDLNFCYLDLIAAAYGKRGSGIGSAIYQHVREEARSMGVIGLFFECLPDDPRLSPEPKVREENENRLAFYERFGARPIAGTAYETPVVKGGDNPPYLVFDDLGQGRALTRKSAQAIVRAILERKYASICDEAYIRLVLNSFLDDPVKIREPRYLRSPSKTRSQGELPQFQRVEKIVLVVNDKHAIHHVRERGYVESPVRIKSILDAILPTGYFKLLPVRHFAERYITSVHDRTYVHFLKRASALVPQGKSIYPYTFPIRNHSKPPKELPLRAGYYCIDTFTPINQNAYLAASGAVDCALTAAAALQKGSHLAYALVRPPGHHAETRAFGGFCYFNSAAIAAHQLSLTGKVAMLDLDYHHGNGQQEIFYRRGDVLTVSLHGPPRTTYPYFSGFKTENGEGSGRGFNVNLPLVENIPFDVFHQTLEKALARIRRFSPRYLVVCLGLDTAKGDPTGSWEFQAKHFQTIGKTVATTGKPTLVVQEGGYRTRSLGQNARGFFVGLHEGCFPSITPKRKSSPKKVQP